MTACRRLRTLLVLLLLLATAPLLAQDTYVHIRWVNLIPDAPAMNYHLNSSSSAPLSSPVSFRGASDPTIMATLGTAGVYFTDASNGAELFSTNVPLANSTRQNIVLIGRLGSIQAKILSLTIPPPTESPEADFRFMNASPDGGSVDLKIHEADGSTQTVNNLAFGSVTEFLSLAVGMTRLEVFAAGTQNRLLNVQGLTRAGFYYTGFVAGMANDLDFRILVESDQRIQNPMARWVTPPPPNDAELRLVNMTGGDGAIDIYMDGVKKIGEVTYRSTSAISGIPSGARTFKFVVAGESIDQAFHTETITVAAGTSISAVVMGAPPSPVEVRMFVRTISETVESGRTKARVLLANSIPIDLDIVLRDTAGTELRVTDAQYGVASEFMTLAAGPVMLELGLSGQPAAVRYLGTLPSAGVATIFVSGDTTSGISVNMLVETDPAVRRPMVAFVMAGMGALRFVHASSPTPAVEMTAHAAAPTTQSLTYGVAGAGIGPIFAGLLPVTVRTPGSPTPMIEQNIQIRNDSLTTTFLVGGSGNLELVQLYAGGTDSEPEPAHANVRLFIAAPVPQPIDVEIFYSTGAKRRFDTLEYKEATRYFDVPAGAITLAIYPRGGTTPLVRLTGAVEANDMLTLVLAGISLAGEAQVAVLDDMREERQDPMPLLAPASGVPAERARIANARIAPNPARDFALIEYTPSSAGDARVALFDITGRPRADVASGGDAVATRRVSMPVGELESGIYSVVVTQADGSSATAGTLQIVR
jgi:hypothetical protein